MSPRTGRPKVDIPKDIRFSIRLDEETNAELDTYCKENSITKAEAIRKGIHLLFEPKEIERYRPEKVVNALKQKFPSVNIIMQSETSFKNKNLKGTFIMARKSVIEKAESMIGKINKRYSLRTSEITELYSQSGNQFYMITNSFNYGYMQGMKAAKDEMKRGVTLND